jgi:hypothetical protein
MLACALRVRQFQAPGQGTTLVMRLATRLLSNAATSYLRLGTTVLLALFTTWYILGTAGVLGFGLIALASSSTGLSHALERSFRFGLVRDLSAAIATRDPAAMRRSVTSAFRLSAQAAWLLAAFVLVLAGLAWAGVFNTPREQPELRSALAILVLAEGVHALVRLLTAPYFQALFAARWIALDNLLTVISRATYALSAVLVFGWLLRDAGLAVQIGGFAAARASLQLVDVALGVWLARRRLPGLRLDRSAYDEADYRQVRSTVWHSSQVTLLQGLGPKFLAVAINLFFGLTYNGLWQIVLQLSSFVKLFSEALLGGIEPVVAHLQEGGRGRAVIGLMARSVRYQLAVTLPMALVLALWTRPLLELWVGSRLAADANLIAAGISVERALDLVTAMVWVILGWQIVRAGFLGVERILYGMGRVKSYAWFPKWGTLIAVVSGVLLMAWLDQPIAAPIALLISQGCFSLGAVMSAARHEVGLSVATVVRDSLPRPLAAALALLAVLLPFRLLFDRLSIPGLALLAAGSAVAFVTLLALLIPRADERPHVLRLLRGALPWRSSRRQPLPDEPAG